VICHGITNLRQQLQKLLLVLTNHLRELGISVSDLLQDRLEHSGLLLYKLAQMLEANKWKAMKSRPVSDKTIETLEHGDWRTQKVTRYELAKVLTSMGDYIANGLPRPAPGAKDLSKSTVLPPKPVLKLDKSNPAYAALKYLVDADMVTPDSPLLKADSKLLLGVELSHALAAMVIGLNNRATELGLDEDGSTHDVNSKPKSPK